MTGISGLNNENGIMISSAEVTCNRLIRGRALSDIFVIEGAQISSSSSITLEASRDIIIEGANILGTNTQISADGDLFLIAGRDLSFLDGATSIPVATTLGSAFFVVDNQFPTSPNFGPGAFTSQPSALISSSGELRIYTVNPDQNTIGSLLNGSAFVAGPFNVDTNTEKWGIYFQAGSFGGPFFTIYYKIGGIPLFSLFTSQAISQFSNYEPMVQFGQFPSPGFTPIGIYHGNICPCDILFDPYRAFIFEDDIYWTEPNIIYD
jgi:hypothetical protein